MTDQMPPQPETEPEVVAATSDPIPLDAPPETIDQVREDLVASLREKAAAAGWGAKEAQVTLHVLDHDDPDAPRVLHAEAVRGAPITPPGPGHAPHWQRVHTDSGHRLRLVGANGEPIVWSEHYTEPHTVTEALDLVRRSFENTTIHVVSGSAATQTKSGTPTALPPLVDVDERDQPDTDDQDEGDQ